ncbi:GNAT family N-acetyltransferase [Photobacterium damselae]|uniref:GNAT family N-acetyltransferase n=1 Tax=Photobacterium damselae TaxID=38293 RepID=UPI001F2CD5DD|nr:GNAT family N-acetyltransferase [Photobacterium damselae]UKA04449.1 hypothetical protein IHC89_22770 [Photobacterium damselae subsp. damselae]
MQYRVITACVANVKNGFSVYSAVLKQAVAHYNARSNSPVSINMDVDRSEYGELFYSLAIDSSGLLIGGVLAETRNYAVGNYIAGIVTWCFVAAEYRGLGFVEKMLAACREEMLERNVLLCDVEIRSADLRLAEYWKRRHGFVNRSLMQSYDPEIVCLTILD